MPKSKSRLHNSIRYPLGRMFWEKATPAERGYILALVGTYYLEAQRRNIILTCLPLATRKAGFAKLPDTVAMFVREIASRYGCTHGDHGLLNDETIATALDKCQAEHISLLAQASRI